MAGLLDDRGTSEADMQGLLGQWQKLQQEYPLISTWGMQVGRSSAPANGRFMEYYPPDETDNPKPGVPYIEVYGNDLGGEELKNMIFGDVLHHAYRADPQIQQIREMFRGSLTPDQLRMSQQRYDRYSNPLPDDPWKSSPETRPYDQWFEVSDLDAMMRGYLAKQWPEDIYTDQQKELLNSVTERLKSKK